MVDKRTLQAELLAVLEDERDTLVAAQRATSDGVTHVETRADSDKDTRAVEASYLARGQAKRAEALIVDVQRVAAMTVRDLDPSQKIVLSALVTLVDDAGEHKEVFLAPAGGGTELSGRVRVITPQSPLGRALLGAEAGDVVEVQRAGAVHEVEIDGVR